jgi:hypothetical protein
MRETDCGAGPDQQRTNTARRRRLALGCLIELRVAQEALHHEQHQQRADKADHRAERERGQHFPNLCHVDAGRSVRTAVDKLVGEPHAEDRSDQRMARRIGQPDRPSRQIPQDRRQQQREDHREPARAADVQDKVDGQQRDDRIGHRAGRQHHPEKIAEPRPNHRERRRHRVRVDDGGDCVGGVVEAVDELEPQRDQQREREERERPARQRLADLRGVGRDAEPRISEPAEEHGQEYPATRRMEIVIELGPR